MRKRTWLVALVLFACVRITPIVKPPPILGAFPILHDATHSPARAGELVREAIDGLGFDGAPDGPRPEDRVFIGRHYIAWVDETGFYGKLQGFWLLNGAEGNALDFVLRAGVAGGRPLNLLIVGERGDGRFPSGYQGAEHLEFPSRTPEANDDPACASRDWCNQYGIDEANPITNKSIPWWSACNVGRSSFDVHHAPIEIATLEDGGLRLVYEAPLTKEADGDGRYDGDACHADYLFPDGVRRRVLLRVGLELHPKERYLDRTVQLMNPQGNPPLVGDMSVIGGFVLTSYPEAHPLKRFAWAGALPPKAGDQVVGWAGTSFALATPEGLSIRVENVGPSDNDDTGGCLCSVHGGIEIGGGLLHAGRSLPIAGGASSIVARRRFSFAPSLR